MKKVNYENYLPIKNSLEFKMPIVKAYSYRSKLYHETMLENIFRTTLNKLAYSFTSEDDKENSKLKVGQENQDDILSKLEIRKNCKIIINFPSKRITKN